MKSQFIIGLFAAAGLLLASSCQTEELDASLETGGATVSFSIGLENGAQTRATISDGTGADKLVFAFYNSSGTLIETITSASITVGSTTTTLTSTNGLFTATDAFSGLKSSVEVSLAKGQTYTVLFWAQDADCTAYTTTDLKAVTVSYDSANNNDETRDAFYAAKTFTVSGSESIDVTLKRPFAQINVGVTSDDWAAAVASGITVSTSKVTLANVADVINLMDGSVTQTEAVTSGITYTANTIVDSGENALTLSVSDVSYKWLSMSYILVNDETTGAAKATTDANFTFTPTSGGDITLDLTSVPVQRNYRTNIIGKLLTGDIEFNIVIDNAYTGDHTIEIWDGKTKTQPAVSDDGTAWVVSTAAEWAYLATNGVKYNGTALETIQLDADLNFGGYEIKGFGFSGEFDGQGHTMSNMTITPGSSYSAGLFQGDATFSYTDVKDVTFENVTIDNDYTNDKITNTSTAGSGDSQYIENPNVYGWAGIIFGDIQNANPVTLTGVSVKNANIRGVKCVAGLVGFVAYGCTLTIENCSVDGSTITNYPVLGESGFVAGMVGRPVGSVTITNSTVSNTTITAYYAYNRGEWTIQPVIGETSNSAANSLNTDTSVAGDDVVVTKTGLSATGSEFVSTASDLSTKISDSSTLIILSADVDYSGTDLSTLTLTADKTIDLNGYTLTLSSDTDGSTGVINVGSYTLTITGGTITNASSTAATTAMKAARIVQNAETPSAKRLIEVQAGGKLVLDGVTLINDMSYHYHGGSDGSEKSAAIAYWENAEITITNSYVYSGMFTLCGFESDGVTENTATVTLTDSYFESNASTTYGTGQYAYALRLYGSEATIKDCIVKGIQGGVGVQGCESATIDGGTYYTENTDGKTDAFYAVYVTGGSTVTILDGEFSGPNSWSSLADGTSSVVAGDNDSGLSPGNFVLKGGKYSGKAYNHKTSSVYEPESGYAWQEISETAASGTALKWEIVESTEE